MTTFAWVIDQTSCIGCHACTTACKSENDVPLGVFRTWVKYVETDTFPATRRQIAVLRCNHCAEPPCVEICPTGAMFQRPDGIVDFDTARCIACKACLQACPYDAIYIDPEDHVAEKCNFCSHRVDRGLLPACVVVCPTESLVFGDLDDPRSRVSQLVASRPTTVRRPEQKTRPKTFYIGAAEAVLDPLAAPREDRYVWADRRPLDADADADVAALTRWRRPGSGGTAGPRFLPVVAAPPNTVRRPSATLDAPTPGRGRAVAAPPARPGPPGDARPVAHVAYDVDHPRPWGAPVAAYLWTKGLAAGPFGVLAAAGLAAAPGGGLAPLLVGGVSLVGLGLTALLLVADLGRPERFWRILLAPQLRSWLALGAYILVAYGGLLGLWLLATAAGLDPAVRGPLGGLAAVGAVAAALGDSAGLVGPGRLALLFGGLGHLLALVGGEALARHPTPNARAAAHLLVRGRYRAAFWLGGVGGGGLLPMVAALAFGDAVLPLAGAGLVAAAALLWYEAGFVAAGQAVPIS